LKHTITFLFLLFSSFCFSQNQKDTLATVKIVSSNLNTLFSKPAPTQIMSKSDLANSNSIADALKQLAGVFIKDYGGVGGLKTISVRSLGANHTAVLYDGLVLGDAQGGQIDLGKFSLDNIVQVQLNNSHSNEILLPARAFASASLINIKTSNALLLQNGKMEFKLKLQQGSFGFFSPAIFYKTLLSKNIQTSIHAEAQESKSNYPFITYENNSIQTKRNNSDLKSQKLEYDLLFSNNKKDIIKFKTYWYNSDRGLPGAIVFYNSTSNQRLKDNNILVQSTWKHIFSNKSQMLFSTKYSFDKNTYSDPNYPNSTGKLDNIFHQKEWYTSAVYSKDVTKYLSVSVASDFFKSTLQRKDSFATNFATPSRNTFLQNVVLVFKKGVFNIQGNVLYTSINEKVTNGKTAQNLHQFSPALSLSVKPFSNSNLYVRSFYKNIFRAATFNDLYYTNIGNTNLLPEYAEQFNVGVIYFNNNKRVIKNLTLTVDAYINNVKDKILAVPRQNLFQWSMQNIGAVKIKGIDVSVNAGLVEAEHLKIHTRLSYTFQEALDISDKQSTQYKTQLPYTPKHNANFMLSVQYKKTILVYNNLMSSYKYKQGDATPENIVNGFASSDVSLAFLFNNNYKIMGEANNIFNAQYEVIRFYPMPRFNYRISFQISLKKQQKVS
jgi:vitamin B12 transporter